MNKDGIRMQELELIQRGLAHWGRVVPQLFTFESQKNKGMVRHA